MRLAGPRDAAILVAALATLAAVAVAVGALPSAVAAQSEGSEPTADSAAPSRGADAAADPAAGPGVDVPPEDVAAIARDLNCPLCQGYNLQDCPLEVCAQMRELIRMRLAEGQTREEIFDSFVAEYGPQVLNEPPRRGFFLGAWVLPIAALLLGAIGVALYVRRSVTAGPGSSGEELTGGEESGGGVDERYARQLEELAGREDE